VKKRLKDQSGSSTIEWMLVMLLLLVFSITIFVLASTASNRYEILERQKKSDSEMRIATSYISTKIRQSDAKDTLHIVERNHGEGTALMIEEVLLGEAYETWIYVSNGKMREATIPANSKLTEEVSFEVAELDYIELQWMDSKGMNITVGGLDGAKRSVFLSLKTLQ
jgi:hypothetical protein